MRTLPTLADLLGALEQSQEVLDFRFQFDKVLMWPFVRAALVHAAFFEAYGLSDAFAKGKRLKLLDCGSYLFQTILKNPFTAKRNNGSAIVMFASGITNVFRDGSYFNRLHDSLASERPSETLLIEDSVRKKYFRPRAFGNVRYHDLIPILAILESKLTPLEQKDEARINEFVSFLKAHFGYTLKEQVWLQVRRILRSRCTRLQPLRRYYDSLFDQLKPEILFVEDGSYGPKGHILKWAKAGGIVTAELQHGLVSRNHVAYNYGDAIHTSSSYRDYLPDYLLTYGEYWNSKTTIPSKKIPMGNPNLTEYVPRPAAGSRRKQNLVLLISGGGNPEGLKRITFDLLRIMNPEQYEICFRPHPGEIPLLRERYGDLERKGVTFDLSTDLYSSLIDADVVAGEISTALFEAAYFGKTVFAMDHPYTRLHLDGDTFPLFEDAADLAGLVAQKRSQISDPRSFWAEEWRQNYRAFIATALARQGKQMDDLEPSRHVQTEVQCAGT